MKNRSVEQFKKRRAARILSRLDDLDDNDGRWVTTENGHKVHINAEGEPDMGNPHVLAAMRGTSLSKAKQEAETIRSNIPKLKKAVSSAKAQVSKAEKKYVAAMGAVRYFDHKAYEAEGDLEGGEKAYKEKLLERDKAEKAYLKAVDTYNRARGDVNTAVNRIYELNSIIFPKSIDADDDDIPF